MCHLTCKLSNMHVEKEKLIGSRVKSAEGIGGSFLKGGLAKKYQIPLKCLQGLPTKITPCT